MRAWIKNDLDVLDTQQGNTRQLVYTVNSESSKITVYAFFTNEKIVHAKPPVVIPFTQEQTNILGKLDWESDEVVEAGTT